MLNYRILFSVVLLTILDGHAQVSDAGKTLPAPRWARTRSVDTRHIALDLRLDWKEKAAVGTATVTFVPLRPIREVKLDAGMLSIHSIRTLDGHAVPFEYDGGDQNDGLKIDLTRTYQPTEEVTVVISYQTRWSSPSDPNSLGGTNGKGLRFFGPTATEPTRRHQIWSMGEPESNRYWFPGFDAPSDLRTTELKATVDKKFTVISNGLLTQVIENTDGTHTFQYRVDQPYANHLTSIVVGEFVDIPQKWGDLALHNYSLPNEVAATTASVEQLPSMVKYFSEVTGLDYPYPSYSQVFVQDLPWGIGTHGLSTQTENMVDDDRTHRDFLYLWDDLEAETLAQQWFGNCLTPSDWSDVWLSKGFARYFSELYDARQNGNEEFHLYSRSFDRNNNYLFSWNTGYRHPLVTRHYEDANVFINDAYAGFHGAEVLHMLRKHLGDEVFWKAIRLYVKRNAHRLVTTEDFRRAVEEASGEPMDWFFDQWVYRMGHPVFVVTQSYDERLKQLKLQVTQTQQMDSTDSYPQVRFFQGWVDIEIDDHMERRWIEPKRVNEFVFELNTQPRLVHFDYEDTWVKEITFQKSLTELLYQFEHDRDILGRRWAGNQLASLASSADINSREKEQILVAFRKLIKSDAYWRFKWTDGIIPIQNLVGAASADQPVDLDTATVNVLMEAIQKSQAWVRAAAIRLLGSSRDPKYVEIYINALGDSSDRVINAAAIALGRSKSDRAFPALARLVNKPSWKNQSLISALFGLQQLNDPRGYAIALKALKDLHSPHWVLGVPVWDYRIIAAQTIRTLGRSKDAFPFLLDGFQKALKENDIHGIFYNTLLIAELADPRGQDVFATLKQRFKDDPNALTAVSQQETRFSELLR